MIDYFAEFAALVSLGATVPAVTMSTYVIVEWAPKAYKSLLKQPKFKTSGDWLILGVVLGFIGYDGDSTYWAFPWTASYLNLDSQEVLFSSGVYFNVVLRQGLGILSAFCHLKASELAKNKSKKWAFNIFSISTMVGFTCATILALMKPYFGIPG